jgi:hypothetical protein
MKMTQRAGQAMLVKAARLLLPLQEDFVFLGGLTMALLVSEFSMAAWKLSLSHKPPSQRCRHFWQRRSRII